MSKLKSFASFWYDFIIGDDWRIALGVAISLGLTAFLVDKFQLTSWWVLPLLVMVSLAVSLGYAIKRK